MSLFKSLRGKRENLPSTKTDGYAYFCVDDGTFWIDYKDQNGVVQRKQLNAKDAETIMGASLSTILNDSEAEIPTSKAVSAAISLMDSKIKGEIGTKQDKITTSGILQGDGSGNITAAQEEEVQLVEITPEIIGAATPTKVLSISLSAESWTGSDPYSQTVSISGGTEKSKVDIQPNATVVQKMINDGVNWIYIENNNGVFTAKAIGAQPSLDITVQVAITEVDTLS